MAPELLHVAWVLLVVLSALAFAVFALLVTLRLARMAIERRVEHRRAGIRAAFFDVLMGDPEDAETARAALLRRTGRAWEHAEEQAFEMLPKIKGESRAQLVGLLVAKGAVHRARRLARSFGAVRRCRGAFALGALGDGDSFPRLIELLEDRHFLVRRVAVRALGNLGDPAAVTPLLEVIGEEPRLARDLVYALDRIGAPGAATLRAEVERGLAQPDERHLHADLAATVLGLIDDIAAAPVLARGLRSPQPGIAVACAEALGRLGTPEPIPNLVEALHHERPALRIAAAHALGSLGSVAAVDSLLGVVEENDSGVSRQAADALRSLGPAGMEVLAASASPYAVEAVALAGLRAGR